MQATDSLTLSEALARARTARPRIAAAAALVERARGTARLGALVSNPTVQYEVDDNAPTQKLTATQPLAWLPRRAADLAAGRAGVARALADSVQLVADVARDVRRSFYGALAADQQLALAVDQATFADSLARLAARRAAAGDISDLERDQIALEASRARLVAQQAREEAEVAREDFARAIAWDGPPPRPRGRLDEGIADSSRSPARIPLDSLSLVRGAVADSLAAAYRLRSARIARIPIPGLVVGREWGGSSAGSNMILGLAVPLPVFSRGGESMQQAQGAADEFSALASEARRDGRARLASALARVEHSAGRARFARDALLPEARRVRAGAVRLYEEGATSVLPVLDALRAEREVTRAAVTEALTYQHALADLDALLGRGP